MVFGCSIGVVVNGDHILKWIWVWFEISWVLLPPFPPNPPNLESDEIENDGVKLKSGSFECDGKENGGVGLRNYAFECDRIENISVELKSRAFECDGMENGGIKLKSAAFESSGESYIIHDLLKFILNYTSHYRPCWIDSIKPDFKSRQAVIKML